jgi:hypothetical protein
MTEKTEELIGEMPDAERMKEWLNAGWEIHIAKAKHYAGFVLTCTKEE